LPESTFGETLVVVKNAVLVGLTALLLGLLAATSARAQGALTETHHFVFPQNFVLLNPCTGHLIAFAGDDDAVVHVTLDPTGGLHRVSVDHLAITGTDLVTGATFRAVGAVVGQDSLDLSGSRSEFTLKQGTNFIGPGPGNNLIQHETIHVTVDANGDVTATVDNLSIECR
jgi:hypothetical protein